MNGHFLTNDEDHVCVKKLLLTSCAPLIHCSLELIISSFDAEGLNFWKPIALFTAVLGVSALPSKATKPVSTEKAFTLNFEESTSTKRPRVAVLPVDTKGSRRPISACTITQKRKVS